MDLKERISTAEAAIARVQTELAALHNEAQTLQRAGYEPPSSMDAGAISVAARKTAEAQAEAQQQLTGVNAAVGALQPILKQYLAELSALRLQQREIDEREFEKLARGELQKNAEVFNDLSKKLEESMVQLHASGEKLNRAQGLGNLPKFESLVNSVPVLEWQRGCFWLASKPVNLNQNLNEVPLAKQFPVNLGQGQQPVNTLQLQGEINQLEVTAAELKEELSAYRIKLSQFEHHSRGPEVSWASAVRHAISQKEPMLEQAEMKLQKLKAQIGAANGAR